MGQPSLPYFHFPAFDNILNAAESSASKDAIQRISPESISKMVDADDAAAKSSSTESKDTGLISDLALILIVAGIATVLFKRLKQPVVLGYIVAGFIVGPHFGYFPSVVHESNIEFWAELGIIFLLFSLGLEFSFRKLINVGGSAAITALIIISGMMSTGFFAGKIMGFSFVSSLFLGGMLSMSSTTIILKALTDLNMLHRRFTSQVLAVLIIEDLFAVVMMVLLSSIAINNSISGDELFTSVAKLVFFIILWFAVGVYLIPPFLQKQRKFLSDELLLIISIGLCFLMVISSTYTGFSAALGAFIMGSILAGTSEAERIEKLVLPVKNLFGAVFFISVGMMVDPQIIATYSTSIITLSLIVIFGMILFGTLGMLITGQPLRIAIESGFSLTQIGEFSFIIASLGMSLHVVNADLYPIVVAVSVVTTFFTPYFIKLSDPFSRWMEAKMPARLMSLINRYSTASTHNESEMTLLWKQIAKRNIWRILLYSVLLTAIIFLSKQLLLPILNDAFDSLWAVRLTDIAITITIMAPFLLALCYPSAKKWEREKLQRSVRSNMPFIAIRLIRILIALGFIVAFMLTVYSHIIAISIAISLFILIAIYFSKTVKARMQKIESQFISNLNERELSRNGRNNNLVSDMHMAYINIGYNCPFVGEKLRNSGLGKNLGVNVASIRRGDKTIAIPTGDMRIFPGDTLGVIGTDEQIQQLLDIVENSANSQKDNADNNPKIEFTSIVLSKNSPIIDKKIADTDIRERYCAMLVSVEHADGSFENPTGETVLHEGDNIWVVGDEHLLKQLA